MNDVHVIALPDGGLQIRLSKEDAERFVGQSFPALLSIRDRVREQAMVAECERTCREAVAR